jgi:hypothetical protein
MRLEMPDGKSVWAQVAEQRGPQDSGLREDVAEKLQGFTECLQSVATSTRNALAAVRPNEVSVEFGLELSAGKDGVVAALVGASGTATVNVTLTWNEADGPVAAPPSTS